MPPLCHQQSGTVLDGDTTWGLLREGPRLCQGCVPCAGTRLTFVRRYTCWLRSSATLLKPLALLTGDHEPEDVGLEDHQDGHRDGQPDRPLQNQAQEVAFLALKARGARAYGQVLR